MTDHETLYRLLGAAYDLSLHGKEGQAVIDLRRSLADVSNLAQYARQCNAEMETVLAAGRRCHITEVYHRLLTSALAGIT